MPSVLELAVIANKIYEENVTSIGPWNRVDISGSDQWGFYASVFLHNNGNDAVIAFRGTDDIADGVEGLGIFLGRYPNQAVQASAILTTWRNRHGRTLFSPRYYPDMPWPEIWSMPEVLCFANILWIMSWQHYAGITSTPKKSISPDFNPNLTT